MSATSSGQAQVTNTHSTSPIEPKCKVMQLVLVLRNAHYLGVHGACCARSQVVPFFTTTWEHYFTDRMILPIVNGPSEGVRNQAHRESRSPFLLSIGLSIVRSRKCDSSGCYALPAELYSTAQNSMLSLRHFFFSLTHEKLIPRRDLIEKWSLANISLSSSPGVPISWWQVMLGIVAACLRGYYGIEFFDEPREQLGGATYGMALIGFSLSGVVLTVLVQL